MIKMLSKSMGYVLLLRQGRKEKSILEVDKSNDKIII